MVRAEDMSLPTAFRALQPRGPVVQLGAPALLPFPLAAPGGTESSVAGRMPALQGGQSKADSRMSSRSGTGAVGSSSVRILTLGGPQQLSG